MGTVDWDLLSSMRERFLSERPAAGGDYWETSAHLESYDATFGARIGWKWDAVIAETEARGWTVPEGAALLDFGCGTGVASRRMLDAFGATSFTSLWVFDRSSRAEDFAERKTREAVPSLQIRRFRDERPSDPFVLVVSHVLNELSESAEAALLGLAADAETIFWVEPGTKDLSRRLIAIREGLRSSFHLVAPCTHRERCGLLSPENARHWCHHFAKPAPEAFTSAHWARFGRELRIDLRSLPVSFLVLDRREPTAAAGARVVGRPRRYKGYTTYLSCESTGVSERRAQKRTDPVAFETLQNDSFTARVPPLLDDE